MLILPLLSLVISRNTARSLLLLLSDQNVPPLDYYGHPGARHPDWSMERTLLAVQASLKVQGVPVQYFQLDDVSLILSRSCVVDLSFFCFCDCLLTREIFTLSGGSSRRTVTLVGWRSGDLATRRSTAAPATARGRKLQWTCSRPATSAFSRATHRSHCTVSAANFLTCACCCGSDQNASPFSGPD